MHLGQNLTAITPSRAENVVSAITDPTMTHCSLEPRTKSFPFQLGGCPLGIHQVPPPQLEKDH